MIAAKFSVVAALLVASSTAETSHLRRKLAKNDFCNPVALSTDAFSGLPKYDTDVFFTAITNGAPLDGFALQAVMPSSYNGIVDCSYMLGANRELLECEVVGSAVSVDPNAVLVKCVYLTNTIDGNVTIVSVQETAIAKCACLCEQDREITGIFMDGMCGCFCEPKMEDCQCMAPDSTDFVDAINFAYMNSTIGETVDAKVTRIYEIEVLDFEDCGAPNITTFNITGVCLGADSEAFSKFFTEAPVGGNLPIEDTDDEFDAAPTSAAPSASTSASPTGSPTVKPTKSPKVKPTESPTGTPTESPIATSPKVKPTESPTGTPTESPIATETESPTGAPTLPHRIPVDPTDPPTTSEKEQANPIDGDLPTSSQVDFPPRDDEGDREDKESEGSK